VRLSRVFLIGFLIVFTAGRAFAQQTTTPSKDSHKHRTILTIAGASGGFAAGFYIGRAAYDTPDSDRRVWTTSAITAAVGGAGGYFLGWVLDNRRNRSRRALGSGKFNVSPILSKDARGLHFSIGL